MKQYSKKTIGFKLNKINEKSWRNKLTTMRILKAINSSKQRCFWKPTYIINENAIHKIIRATEKKASRTKNRKKWQIKNKIIAKTKRLKPFWQWKEKITWNLNWTNLSMSRFYFLVTAWVDDDDKASIIEFKFDPGFFFKLELQFLSSRYLWAELFIRFKNKIFAWSSGSQSSGCHIISWPSRRGQSV